jgi:hypothetical protein
VGRLHLHRCRPTRLRLMGALSLTRRKPRGRSGLHSTPGLASTVLTRRLAPAWGIFARTVPGVVPPALHARFPSVPTSGVRSPVIHQFLPLGFDPRRDSIYDKSLTGEPILPSRTADQYLARYWSAVRDGKIGSPVRDLSIAIIAASPDVGIIGPHFNVSSHSPSVSGYIQKFDPWVPPSF